MVPALMENDSSKNSFFLNIWKFRDFHYLYLLNSQQGNYVLYYLYIELLGYIFNKFSTSYFIAILNPILLFKIDFQSVFLISSFRSLYLITSLLINKKSLIEILDSWVVFQNYRTVELTRSYFMVTVLFSISLKYNSTIPLTNLKSKGIN